MAEDELEYEGSVITGDQIIGFVKITKLGTAQQVTVDLDILTKVTRFLSSMSKMGVSDLVITVQKGKPLILGTKILGVGIATIWEKE